MESIPNILKSEKTATISVILGVLIPAITYPLTTISNFAFLKQMAFAKQGVFYEPTMTEYSLNIFGIFRLPYGSILAICIGLVIFGSVRLYYIKHT